MKSNLIYNSDKLYVNLDGKVNKKDFKNICHKIDYLTSEYQINDIVFNIEKLDNNIDKLINDYKYEFSGEITIEK